MSYENPNHKSWKAQLDAMSGLDGENQPDKNASWNKLYLRLNKKKESRKPVLYWLVAASILAAMVTLVFFYSEKPATKNELSGIPLKTTEKKEMLTEKENEILVDHPPVINDKLVPAKKENLVLTQKNKIPGTLAPGIRVTDTVSVLKEPVLNMSPANETKSVDQMVAILPEKKKLKVVHINTINETPKSSRYLVKIPVKKVFQFNFGDQQVLESPGNFKNKNASLFEINTSIN